MKRSKVVQTYLLSGLGVAIMAAILVGVNIVAYIFNHTGDFTEEDLFTLSDGTRNILADLPGPVTLRFYYTRGLEDDPELVTLSNFAKHLQDLLEEYADSSRGRITLEIYDPSPDTDAEDAALLDGMRPRSLASGERFYLGMTAQYLDPATAQIRIRRMPSVTPEQEVRLEYDITRLIFDITRGGKPKVGVIDTLGVFGASGRNPVAAIGSGHAWGIIHELRRDFDVIDLGPRPVEIPADLRTLVVIHPEQPTDATLYAIDQYLLRGGSLIAFVDPVCSVQAKKNPMAHIRPIAPGQSSLGRLFDAWGVQYSVDDIVCDNSRKAVAGDQSHVAVIGLLRDAMNPDDIVTADLAALWLAYAGRFAGTPTGDLSMTPLLTSTADSQLMGASRFIHGVSPHIIAQDFKADPHTYDLAVRLTGHFPTAFPEGPPPLPPPEAEPGLPTPPPNLTEDDVRGPTYDDNGVARPPASTPDADADADAGSVAGGGDEPDFDRGLDELGEDATMQQMEREANHLMQATGRGNVILVADADMLENDFWIRQPPKGSQEPPRLTSHNAVFLLNAVEQLTGNSDLISIRSKGFDRRPFTTIEAKKEAAKEKWRERELEKKAQLKELQDQIGRIRQGEEDGRQVYYLTPEQEAKLAQLVEMRAETQRAYREILKDQKRDINRVENTLKWLNIAAIPFLIIHFALVFLVLRRGREQSR